MVTDWFVVNRNVGTGRSWSTRYSRMTYYNNQSLVDNVLESCFCSLSKCDFTRLLFIEWWCDVGRLIWCVFIIYSYLCKEQSTVKSGVVSGQRKRCGHWTTLTDVNSSAISPGLLMCPRQSAGYFGRSLQDFRFLAQLAFLMESLSIF